MRRIFALLLVTPLLANCSESKTPLAPSDPVRSVGNMHAGMHADMAMDDAWPAEENWFTAGDALSLVGDQLSGQPDGGISIQSVGESPFPPVPGVVMLFGNSELGTDFHPTGVHDQSYQSRDKIRPGSVSIDAGETVTFDSYPGHRVAIYDVGTVPSDIQRTPGPLLLDPHHRLFLQPFPAPQFTLRFIRPGKYLVICAINQHFFDGNMWGWIVVR